MGYKMLVIMPNGVTRERAAISEAYGAQVMTVGDFHVNDALVNARQLAETAGFFAPQQFDSEWNVDENRTWLGPEILEQLPPRTLPDAVVAGVRTGGTIIGVGQCFRECNPDCRVARSPYARPPDALVCVSPALTVHSKMSDLRSIPQTTGDIALRG
jgi:cysteine synthase A